MKLSTKFVSLFSILAIIASILPLAASIANAATGDGSGNDCPADRFCLYDGVGFKGRRLVFINGDPLNKYGFNDSAESYVNNTNTSVTLTDSHRFRPDQTRSLSPRERSSDMGGWCNRIDKVKVNR
jgi:hypothetical protein